MKIKFADDFNGSKLDVQIGDKPFSFTNGGTPFDINEDVGRHLIGLGFFVECAPETEAVPTAELPKQAVQRKG